MWSQLVAALLSKVTRGHLHDIYKVIYKVMMTDMMWQQPGPVAEVGELGRRRAESRARTGVLAEDQGQGAGLAAAASAGRESVSSTPPAPGGVQLQNLTRVRHKLRVERDEGSEQD